MPAGNYDNWKTSDPNEEENDRIQDGIDGFMYEYEDRCDAITSIYDAINQTEEKTIPKKCFDALMGIVVPEVEKLRSEMYSQWNGDIPPGCYNDPPVEIWEELDTIFEDHKEDE